MPFNSLSEVSKVSSPFFKDHSLTEATENDPSAFSLLHRLYESDIAWWLKNDLACRILTLRYHAEATSILLYDGLYDKLVNMGSYIRPRKLKLNSEKDPLGDAKAHFLDHVAFYDFLYHRFQYSGIPADNLSDDRCAVLIKEFNSEKNSYFNYRFPVNLFKKEGIVLEQNEEKEFVRICQTNSIELACKGPKVDAPILMEDGKHYKIAEDSFYRYYKWYFKQKEKYKIAPYMNAKEPGNLSGCLYHMVRVGDLPMPSIKRFFKKENEFNGGSFNEKKIEDNARKYLVHLASNDLGITPPEDLDYIGLPLWSNERCIGIIRMLFSKESDKNPFNGNIENGGEDKRDTNQKERFKSIRHAMEMMGTFIDREYSVTHEDEITFDTTSASSEHKSHSQIKPNPRKGNNLEQEAKEPIIRELDFEQRFRNNFCNGIRAAIDALGTTLRYVDEKEKKAKLMGYSDDSPGFKEFVEKFLLPVTDVKSTKDNLIIEGEFAKAIGKYFRQSNKRNPDGVLSKYTLVAVATEVDNWQNTYYYQHTHKRRIRNTSEDFLFTDDQFGRKQIPRIQEILNDEAVVGLKNISMPEDLLDTNSVKYSVRGKYILIVDIPKSYVDGILVVTNSENRPFNLSDVEFVHSELDRMSLEQRKAEQVGLQKVTEYLSNFWHVSKNITQFVNSSYNDLKQKVNSDKTPSPHLKEIFDLGKWMRLATEKLTQGHDYLQSQGAKNLQEYLNNWDIVLEIKTYAEILLDAAKLYRQIDGIEIIYEKNSFEPVISKNRNFVLMCIFNYLENAIKYSFNKANRESHDQWQNADEELRQQLSNIVVRLYKVKNDLVYSVQSFGLEVLDPSKVFEFQTSIDDEGRSTNFLNENNPSDEKGTARSILFEKSTKKGITTLKQVMKEINCECICEKNRNISTFKLIIHNPSPIWE